jgi:cytochrome c553
VDGSKLIHLPGSIRAYSGDQIEDNFNPPDWFPDQHPQAPKIITQGDGPNVPACGSCHLMSGLGHPESANLAGLSPGYIESQLRYFKTGDRKDSFKMTGIGMNLSEADAKVAGEWFASLKPALWDKVVESETAPKTYIRYPRMRIPSADGGSELLGERIIEVPEDQQSAQALDPNARFIAYVPVGSIARGELLVTTRKSGKTIPCATCHGATLTGLGDVPRIAGLSPEYQARELYRFKDGTRNGRTASLMKVVVEHLDAEDIIDISAYLASKHP